MDDSRHRRDGVTGAPVAGVSLRHRHHVAAGAERRTRGIQQNRRHGGIAGEFDRHIPPAATHLEVHGVQARGTVQGDVREAVLDLDQDGIAHLGLLQQ